jgi:alanine-synthesizing transaminase
MFASRTNWPLAANRLTTLLGDSRRRGTRVLDLTESNPTRSGFDFDAPEILGALCDPRSLTYEPDPRGMRVGREAVAGYYSERGVEVDPQNIFLTTSTSEAYSYVFRLLADPGDRILVPRPSYPLFDFLAGLNDVEIVPYPLNYGQGWFLDEAALEARLSPRSRAVLAVSPNNPTGSFVKQGELEFLAGLAARRSLALICDEVFADYAFGLDPNRVASFALESQALTFTFSGLSKISALPQMKLAWIVVNGRGELLASALARLEVIADTYLSVSAPLACALPRLMAMRRLMQPQLLARVLANLAWLDAELARGLPVSRLEVEGGWYVTLRLPSTRTDEDWALDLLRRDGVYTMPGHFFDFPAESHLVVSLLPKPEIFEEGITKLLARVAGPS